MGASQPTMSNPTAIAKVESLLRELGLEARAKRISESVWAITKGSATVQVVAAPEFVVATAKVADGLPANNREGLMRTLLMANVQLLGAFFTIEANDTVRLNQVLPLEWLQAQELAFIIGNVASKADEWDDRLTALNSSSS